MALLIASNIASDNVTTDFFLCGIQRRANNYNSVNFTFTNNAGDCISVQYKPAKGEKPDTAVISYNTKVSKMQDVNALFTLEETLRVFKSYEILKFGIKDSVATYVWKLNR